MSAASVFDAIPLVTTPLSLVAFLAAVAVMVHARAIGRAEKLIRTAPDLDRRTLVAGALEILDLKSSRLSKEQTYELALETLRHRRLRSLLAFSVIVIIALVFGGLAIYSIVNVEPGKVIDDLLASDEKRRTAITELKQHGIFDASDADLVGFMIDKTSIPKSKEQSLSDKDFVDLATQQYDSVASVKELRRRAATKADPFKPIGQSQTVTVPSERDDQPRQFLAHVPIGSPFAWKIIKVTNPDNGKTLRLLARPAIDDGVRGTDLQINREQSIYIFDGPLVPAKLTVIVRETVENIFDPNCSEKGRGPRFTRVASLACKQGSSVDAAFLYGTLGQ